MSHRFFCSAIISIFIFSSCNNSSNTSEITKVTDSTSVVEEVKTEVIDQAFPRLYEFLKKQDPSFDVKNFQHGKTIEFEDSLGTPQDTTELKSYIPYLLFNSDSSMALDLVTYNYAVEVESGKTIFEGAGPDYEVAMINFKTGNRKRLLFFGPFAVVFDARWQGDSVVFVAGTTDFVGKDSMLPLIWKYEVKNRLWSEFHYPQMIHADWTKYKLPKHISP